jgi:hypothetical protein
MNAYSHNHSVPASRRFSLLATAASLMLGAVSVLNAASFNFSGNLQAGNLTATPWVKVPLSPPALEPSFQTFMWGSIETGGGTGTAQAGFAYLASRDVGLLTFTSGDLELTTFQSPGPATLGFERYTENDGSVLPFTIRYDGAIIATGTSDFLYDEVSHQYDLAAVGNGQVTLTAAGADPTFYNEVLALTGGTGRLQVTLASFDPVDNAGLFATTGSFTAVPEPEAYSALAAAGLMGWAAWRRSRGAAAN